MSDLPVDEQPFPHHVSLSLRFSKIDQFGKGCTLVLDRSGSLICPLEALMSYPWSRGNKQGPLCFDENFSPLTKSKFFNKLKILLKVAGFDGNSTLHSFRGNSTLHYYNCSCSGVFQSICRKL